MARRKKYDASVIIPVWNEKHNIASVLNRIPKSKKYEIIVVDDGSTDNTLDVIKSFGFEPIALGQHLGKGEACKRGAQAASSEFLVFMDGDNQHNPVQIPSFVKMLKKSDLVLGYRNMDTIPVHRRFSNMCSTKLFNRVAGKEIYDVQCGFRAIKKSRFEELSMDSKGYQFEIEMVLGAIKKKMKISQIPVDVFYSKKSEITGKSRIGSRMSVLSSFVQLVYLVSCLANYR